MRKTSGQSVPEGDDATVRSLLLLRIELLYAAVVYGMCAMLSDGGDETGIWLDWLEWVRDLISAMRERLDPFCDDHEPPQWLRQAIEAAEQTESTTRHDLFRESVVRHWAREEFELLAERSRPIERVTGEPLGETEDRPSPAGLRLLGAIQDSLALVSAAPDEAAGQRRASAAEVLDHLIAAREEGVWELLTS
jgi:hypothetical protein